jgi:hypothetical protein
MGGYLFFKSSGLLFPRLTKQHPFTRLPHAMRLRLFIQAHQGISKLTANRAWSADIASHEVGDLYPVISSGQMSPSL